MRKHPLLACTTAIFMLVIVLACRLVAGGLRSAAAAANTPIVAQLVVMKLSDPGGLRARHLARHRRPLRGARHRRAHPRQAPVAHETAAYRPLQGPFSALRDCESGGNYTEDTGNGYYGAYQFSLSTWAGLGMSGRPNDAPPAVQDAAARALVLRTGWSSWPACSVMLHL